MKIGIYCTNNVPYPIPKGTIYANMHVAGKLADTHASNGHDVTFFAPKGSTSNAEVVTFDMLPFGDKRIYSQFEHSNASFHYENIMLVKALNYAIENNFDIFHAHSRPFSIIDYAPLKPTLPVLNTIHDPLTDEAYAILYLYNQFKNLHFVSISNAQRKPRPKVRWAATVYDGIDTNFWQYQDKPGNYLMYSGRIMPNKGADLAVKIAQKAGLALKMVGSIYPGDQKFFERTIKPHLGKQIEYLGALPQSKLIPLYQNALALLMPIRWEEPFGLVMAEAMSCGTPVIAANKGSVPEVVKDGYSGYIVTSGRIDTYVKAIKNLTHLNRSDCRKHVEDNFSVSIMAEKYIDVYQSLVTHKK